METVYCSRCLTREEQVVYMVRGILLVPLSLVFAIVTFCAEGLAIAEPGSETWSDNVSKPKRARQGEEDRDRSTLSDGQGRSPRCPINDSSCNDWSDQNKNQPRA